MNDVPEDLLILAKQQLGLLLRRQALQYVSERVLARLVGPHGRWHIPIRGVYATFTGELSADQRRYAGWLYAGAESQVTSIEGCRLYGLRNLPANTHIRYLIDNDRHRQSRDFVIVQRARYLPPHPRMLGEVPVAPLARCVIDATREMQSVDSVRAVMMEAVQRRRVLISSLQRELELGAVAWSARARHVIEELIRGAMSVPEAENADLMASSAILPRCHHNCTLLTPEGRFLAIPDGYIKRAGIMTEVQSLEHHLDSAAQEGDMNRRAEVAAYDVIVFEIRPGRIRPDGARWLANIEASYVERIARGVRPRVLLRCRPECPLQHESDVRPKTPLKTD